MTYSFRYDQFSPMRKPRTTLAFRVVALLLFSSALFTVHTVPLQAQLWVPPPMLKMFGVPDTSFFVSGWMGGFPDSTFVNGTFASDTVAAPYIPQIWDWCDSMGIDIIRRHYNWPVSHAWVHILDSVRTARSQNSHGIILSNMPKDLDESGTAVEWVFFPTDSVRFKELPSAFAYRSGGVDSVNGGSETEDNPLDTAREQVYDTTNTSRGQLILSDITWNYKPNQIYRWSQTFNGSTWDIHRDSVTQQVQEFSDVMMKINDDPIHTCYLTVKGHLYFDTLSTAADTDKLLKIEVWYEMPRYTTDHKVYYWNFVANAKDSTVSANDSSIIRTFYITKKQLKPTSVIDPQWWKYRTITFPFPVYKYNVNDTGALRSGPTYPENTSKRLNIRVYWTGKEKLALRSIALRDSIANLILRTDSASMWDTGMAAKRTTFKNTVLDNVAHVLYGDALDHPRFESIFSVCLNVEQPPQRAACLIEVNKWLRERFNSATDTLFTAPTYGALGFQGWSEYPLPHAVSQIDSFPIVSPEVSVRTFGIWTTKNYFDVPYFHMPSIKEHNGGRFTTGYIEDSIHILHRIPIPELFIDTGSMSNTLDSVERYETQLQLYSYGYYIPGRTMRWVGEGNFCRHIGPSAEISRDRRRRLNSIIFNVGKLKFDLSPISGPVIDTLIDHFPEAAELRFLITGSLAYGARSIEHQILTSAQNFIHRDTIGGVEYWLGETPDWGSGGFRLSDTSSANDHDSAFKIYLPSSSPTGGGYDTAHYYTIPNFYTGWGVRSRETKEIDRWLHRIGPVMMKLNWRDSYSIHYTVTKPYPEKEYGWYWNDYTHDLRIDTLYGRPLPDSEIVTEVRSYARRWLDTGIARRDTLIVDSLSRTYVELGLFYPKNSSSNPVLDSHFVFVVNRRCFERPIDVPDTSPRGRMMDSVSEMRRITLKLNLTHPDATQYCFLHVREVEPDLRPLPLTSTPRKALDTVVYADSLIALTLRAGSGTLLEITYAKPDSSLNKGDLAFNNQRKIIFDGYRYYATYWRYDTTYNTNTVFLHTSLPVLPSTGSILWEPWEDIVSVKTHPVSPKVRYDSRYPSLTWRINNGDTVISVVWTCHPDSNYSAGLRDREVVIRDFNISQNLKSSIRTVDYHAGSDPTQWGTPVICRADSGDFIAWSDSIAGINARFRLLDTGTTWWLNSPTLSAMETMPSLCAPTAFSQYPSVPAFTTIASHYSNCAIVWQEQNCTPPDGGSTIYYARLVFDSTLSGSPIIHTANYLPVSNVPVQNTHPSIDQVQDDYGRGFEGVVWEAYDHRWPPPTYPNSIYYRSMSTPLGKYSNGQDSVGTTSGWGISSLLVNLGIVQGMFPSTGWVRQIHYYPWSAYGYDSIYYSVAYMEQAGTMTQTPITFGGLPFNSPLVYTHNGYQPSASATPLVLNENDGHHTVLYRDIVFTDSLLRTTREYFAKARPTNYLAHGREAVIGLDSTRSAALTMRLFDVWLATDSSAVPLQLSARSNYTTFTDSLPQVRELMRTQCFHAHDSVLVGCNIMGSFLGDTSVARSAKLHCYVEVADSVNGSSVVVLDSFIVQSGSVLHDSTIARDLDLLSGTYYIRMRFVEDSLPVISRANESVYPVIEVSGMVEGNEGDGYGKRTRIRSIGNASSIARINAQPNPFSGETELRFSVPKGEYVTVTVSDALGRVVAMPVEKRWIEPGRYAVELDGSGLKAGVYVAEMKCGQQRVTVKMTVVR